MVSDRIPYVLLFLIIIRLVNLSSPILCLYCHLLHTGSVEAKDYKTVLQEKLQVHGSVDIKYIIVKEYGPDHDKNFVAEVLCNGKVLAEGIGKNKKMAEMEAAKKALENM